MTEKIVLFRACPYDPHCGGKKSGKRGRRTYAIFGERIKIYFFLIENIDDAKGGEYNKFVMDARNLLRRRYETERRKGEGLLFVRKNEKFFIF